ncbi:hypothetical protein [Scandinavium goeteborgense]|uniref:Uncharacterized protein n=1 Tax=Scandinavium goeteborgense TaxID=1851514 RepID=A0A4R6EG42_SCAGO|nr:hypothetical protein [Scandinavium goeteborgense]TDN57285.1 hypothetical protein EC847_10979 [Scandinavium goeteborgense]
MKINNRLMIIALPLIAATVCIAYMQLTAWKQTHFTCESQLSIVDANGSEDIIMHFRFMGKTGHLETRGKYITKKGEGTPTSNRVDFTFWREGHSLIMVSNETNQMSKIPLPVLNNTPDFFTSRERGLRLQVIQKNPTGYLFLYMGTPALYCTVPG